jgi:hypothetical protein
MMYQKNHESQFEKNSGINHPDYESRNTTVSEYLRKYGTGRIDELPKDTRPEIVDDRPDDEKINDEFVDGLGTDELDVMMMLNENAERFKKARIALEEDEKKRVSFDNAVKVLNDPNSSEDAKRDALRILEKLEKAGKVVFD